MYKYALLLKAVAVAGGIDDLDEQRKAIFKGLVEFMATMLRQSNEIDEVEISEDFTLVITAKEDVEDLLKKIGKNAIITRL